ncbi:hypothetical protein HK098_001808 [Nowakowskiella sp. JEL0407]|nr:hypothetical protein HK098_001808 [Nowakowskiella sp. JEL0407]
MEESLSLLLFAACSVMSSEHPIPIPYLVKFLKIASESNPETDSQIKDAITSFIGNPLVFHASDSYSVSVSLELYDTIIKKEQPDADSRIRWFKTATNAILEIFPNSKDEGGYDSSSIDLAKLLLPHIMKLSQFDHSESRSSKDVDTNSKVADLCYYASKFAEFIGNYSTATELMTLKSVEHEITATLLDYHAARRLLTECLEIRLLVTESQPQVTDTRFRLATIDYYEGKYDDARETLQYCLEENEKVVADENTKNIGEARVHHQLGMIVYQEGKYVEAKDRFTLLGNRNHVTIGSALAYLGLISITDKQYDEAKSYLKESLDIFEHCYNSRTNFRVVNVIQNLGKIAFLQGEYEEAAALFAEVVSLQELMNGSRNSISTLDTFSTLTELYSKSWNLLEVENSFSEACRIWEAIRNQIPKDIATIRASALGTTAYNIRKQEEAAAFYRDCIEIFTSSGDDDQSTYTRISYGNSHYYLGEIAFWNRDYEEAVKEYTKALEIYEKSYGSRYHTNWANALSRLARAFQRSGDTESAKMKYEETLEVYEKMYSKEHELYKHIEIQLQCLVDWSE